MKREDPKSIRGYLKNLSKTRSVLSWIKTEITSKKSRKELKMMVILYFVFITFMLFSPLAVGTVFNGITNRNKETIVFGILAFSLCLIIQRMTERKMSKSREFILGEHWRNLDKRLTELFFSKSSGQIIQESALSVSTIDKGRWKLLDLQGLLFFEGISVIIQLSISLLLLCFLSFHAGLAMLSAVFVYVSYSIYLNFHVMQACSPIDKSMRKLNRRRIERLEKAVRVQTSSQENREVEEMTDWFDVEIDKDRRFWFWYIEQSSWRSLVNIALFICIISYGAYLVWNGVWQIGLLYPLYSWTGRITENIWQLSHIEHRINWDLPSVVSMIESLSLEPDIKDKIDCVTLIPEAVPISLSSINHSYPNTEKIDEDDEENGAKESPNEHPHTLKEVSFIIEAGEKVALLGSTGAGKTTIMRLLLRFMDPTEGSILVGNTNLRDISLSSWRKCIGYIPQHAEIFDGTLRDNLTYRLTKEERASMSDEKLWELMRTLEIDFGKRLSNGLDTKVGKHGLKLSGGQAQRLMIGAAVIGKPWFMIIDEATSHLDSTTEKKVQIGLTKVLTQETSALIVAHRLSTVRNLCTKFIVLRASESLANGDSQIEAIASSFEELYKISPTFRTLADDQGIMIL